MELGLAKRALITGAGRRLGQAMAIALAEDGFEVAIHYNGSETGARETLAAVEKAGGKGILLPANLLHEGEVAALVTRASQEMGGALGLLINNASAFEDDDALTHTRSSWDLHMQVNLRAPILLSQSFARDRNEGERGLVINMIDQRVWKLNPNFFTYTLSKSALWSATRTLAQALAPAIRVNGIGPGPTLQNARQDDSDFRKQVEATLTGKGSSPEEIVKAVRFLIDAEAVTGQMIAVDGGQHLIWQTPDVVDVIE